MGSTRDTLIDYLEEAYNYNPTVAEELEAAVEAVGGSLDDSGPDGIYSDLSLSDLERVLDILEGTPEPTYSYAFTEAEIRLIAEAMRNWADPKFSGSREDSRVAARILDKLDR